MGSASLVPFSLESYATRTLLPNHKVRCIDDQGCDLSPEDSCSEVRNAHSWTHFSATHSTKLETQNA